MSSRGAYVHILLYFDEAPFYSLYVKLSCWFLFHIKQKDMRVVSILLYNSPKYWSIPSTYIRHTWIQRDFLILSNNLQLWVLVPPSFLLVSPYVSTEDLVHPLPLPPAVSLGVCMVDRPHGGACRELPGPLCYWHGCRSGDPIPWELGQLPSLPAAQWLPPDRL